MPSPAMLVIRDITRREEERFDLVESMGQLYWDTSNVVSGIYYYSVIGGDDVVSSGKIAVKR